jgi:hypothetical protein
MANGGPISHRAPIKSTRVLSLRIRLASSRQEKIEGHYLSTENQGSEIPSKTGGMRKAGMPSVLERNVYEYCLQNQ